MFCSTCGTAFDGQFCPACGLRPGVSGAAAPAIAETIPSLTGLRCGAALFDALPAVVIALFFGAIPLVGPTISGILLLAWWLLRDVTGASPGKRLLGLRVVSQDGGYATLRQRMLRNVTLIVGPALLALPMTDLLAGPMAAGCLLMLEVAVLIIRRERLGDLLAGTTVVRK